jgi:hypothetical protein
MGDPAANHSLHHAIAISRVRRRGQDSRRHEHHLRHRRGDRYFGCYLGLQGCYAKRQNDRDSVYRICREKQDFIPMILDVSEMPVCSRPCKMAS